MIASILLLVVLLSLGPVASQIPAAVLAGILVTVGIGVMDFKGLKHIRQLPVPEVIVMFLVLGLTVFVGLIQAVFIGLILASVLFMKKISDVVDHRTKFAPIKAYSPELPWVDEGNIIDRIGDKVYIKHLDGPLFFGFASRFSDMLRALPQLAVVVIRMDKVPYIDQSGLYALEDAVMDLHSQGIRVIFTNLHGQPKDILQRFDLVPGLVEKEYSFETFAEASAYLETCLKNKFPEVNSEVEPVV